MASLRDQILEGLRTRFAAVAGWTVTVREDVEAVNVAKGAVIFDEGEANALETDLYYSNTLDVVVLIGVRPEDRSGGTNYYAWLDAALVELQKVVHNDPHTLGITGVEDIVQRGNRKVRPKGETIPRLEWRLSVTYRHDYQDPEVYSPSY